MPTKVYIVKAMVFLVVMYRYESWTTKKAELWRIDAFLLCWRRLLRVPWTSRRSNQSILKEINSEYSLEGLILKLKLENLPPNANSQLIGKDPDTGQDWGQEEKEVTDDEMVEWHHQFNGHESEQTWGDSEGQGSLACCSPWSHKVGCDWVTEQQQRIYSQDSKFCHLRLLYKYHNTRKGSVWCLSCNYRAVNSSYHSYYWCHHSSWWCCYAASPSWGSCLRAIYVVPTALPSLLPSLPCSLLRTPLCVSHNVFSPTFSMQHQTLLTGQ